MRAITAERYRWFKPVAPELSFRIPSLSADGLNTLMYEYLIREESELDHKEIPVAFWNIPESMFEVYIDEILQRPTVRILRSNIYTTWVTKEIGYQKTGMFLHTKYKYLSSREGGMYAHDIVTSMAYGMIVKLVSSESFDGWFHMDIRKLLIQGANPVSHTILGTHDNFQGGYRVDYELLEEPQYGELRRCDYQIGWDYRPAPGYHGIDSFSYRLVTDFGQVSEPACCSIKVGY